MKHAYVYATVCAATSLFLTSCSGGGGSMSGSPAMGVPTSAASASAMPLMPITMMDTDTLANDVDNADRSSVLKRLDEQVTIGSTVPANGEQNPYGLAIAPSDNGKIEPGDLVVCDFNDAANVQGTGSTIIALTPRPGATPRFIAQNPALLGCDELALAPNDEIWNAAFSSNANPLFSPNGQLDLLLHGSPFNHPFGEAFASFDGTNGKAAFYESNAGDGTIVRINIKANGHFTFDVIATGFAVNHGAPGSILGPSGLQYDARHDRLYIVDGSNNTVVALRHVSTIPAGGVTVNLNGTSFSGPFSRRARLVFSGAPLNGPISSALLPNGNLVIGNTLDPNGKNLMVEISSDGHLLDVKNVDTGAAGAIFGMVANGYGEDVKLYFNDDNSNTVQLLK